MTRRVIFDPTAGEAFVRQWQRYDWRLLQNSHVHSFPENDTLCIAIDQLNALGYLIHRIDATPWHSEADLHQALQAALSFPEYYGRNLSALDDALKDLAEYRYGSDSVNTGTVVAIENYDQLVAVGSDLAFRIVDIFARRSRYGALLGHPMLLLIATSADIGEVGAMRVLPALSPE